MKHRIGNHAEILKNFDDFPDATRVRLPVVCLLFGTSPATVWRRVGDGKIPTPRKDGRITYWLAGELRAKLAEGAQ
ncbi:MAG: transcriptional regulator [Gammaproteobacteria bacterium]|nr:transcriptional regulator [Gammaproteobacteria bacterium]MBU1409048.1 transcriptional regulator [Gammaproteobacteria bacterium]MBU1533531.1 transcriptional regulator [Gammaproteobacteria bacterium]